MLKFDPLSFRSALETEIKSALAALKSWSKLPPEVWAEEIYRLPQGRHFRWAYAPYSRAMFRSIFDRMNTETVFEIYSRGLKSTVVLLAIGYIIDQMPRRILVMYPTIGQVEKWSKEILCGELLDTTPCLNFLGTQSGKRNGANTILNKLFPGGLISMFGANSPGEMRRAKGSFLFTDEADAIESISSDEGDQLAIFHKRGDEYPDTIKITASYPSLKGMSRIHARMETSDFRQWQSTCAICGGEPFVMHRSQLIFDHSDPRDARLECPRCGGMLTDAQRYSMAHEQGFDLWRPTREFRGRRGFQANAMLWPHPVDLDKFPGGWLQCVAQQQIDAETSENPQRSLKVLVNTVDAEPFDPVVDAEAPPEWGPLKERCEDFSTVEKITIPMRGLVLTGGGDVHPDRIEWSWIAWAKNEDSWVLDHRVFLGDTKDHSLHGPWAGFRRHLDTEFEHESGIKMRLDFGLLDASFGWEDVRKFVSLSPAGGRLRACRGSAQFPFPIIGPWDKLATGKRGQSTLMGHWVGGDECKDIIYRRLRFIEAPGVAHPDGWIHFGRRLLGKTGDDATYFEQLCSEKMEMDGENRRYLNTDRARNETLDTFVYAYAAFRRKTDWEWEARLAMTSPRTEMPEEQLVPKPREENFLTAGLRW